MVNDPYGARVSYERLVLLQPHVQTLGIWQRGSKFLVHCPDVATTMASDGTPIVKWFGLNRMMGARVELVATIPEDATQLTERTIEEIAELAGDFANTDDFFNDVAMRLPRDFPPYELRERDCSYELAIARPLTNEEAAALASTMRALSCPWPYSVVVRAEIDTPRKQGPMNGLNLVSARDIPTAFNAAVRRAWEEDEDTWMTNRSRLLKGELAVGETLPTLFRASTSRCVVDIGRAKKRNLRSFLPIYRDTALIIPVEADYQPMLDALGVTENELIELARRGRVSFVAPQSIHRYPPALLNRIVEGAPGSLVLSRSLAAAVVTDSRRRLPLFFPTVGAKERREIITTIARALRGAGEEHPLAPILISQITSSWISAERLLHRHGAMATFGGALGSFAAATFEKLRGLEVSVRPIAFLTPL